MKRLRQSQDTLTQGDVKALLSIEQGLLQEQQPMFVGKGGFSSVWRPSLKQGQEPHVIKEPNEKIEGRALKKLLTKYRHQKQLLDRLRSPYFNQIRKINEDGSVVMRDLGDTTLDDVLSTLTRQDKKDIWRQLKDAVFLMFGLGVVHRDIKNNNIMAWMDKGKFHIAFVDLADSFTKQEIFARKRFNDFGTFLYMSPELLKRRCTGNMNKGTWEEYLANDLWALGIVLYHMLHRTDPYHMFEGNKQYAKKYKDFKDILAISRIQCNEKPVRTLHLFYLYMQEDEELYSKLFSSAQKDELTEDVRALLSFDPRTRLAWLRKHSSLQLQPYVFPPQQYASSSQQQQA